MRDLKAWNGRPDNPERSGWHWIEDADGLRPLLWRGDDWPEQMDRGEWQDGYAVLSARDLSRGRYHGPVAMSPRLLALCRRGLAVLEGSCAARTGQRRRVAGNAKPWRYRRFTSQDKQGPSL